MLEPTQSLYRELPGSKAAASRRASFTPGFPAADFPECGPVVFAYGDDLDGVACAAERLREAVEARESDFDLEVFTPEEGVRRAIAIAARATRPVVIADTQDNPGARRQRDTTGMLRALVGATRNALPSG